MPMPEAMPGKAQAIRCYTDFAPTLRTIDPALPRLRRNAEIPPSGEAVNKLLNLLIDAG
jgi:hypothetical protein